MSYVNALEVFHLLLPLLNQLGPGWCLLLLLPLKQVLPARYNAAKGMQRHIVSAGSAARKASEVWKADLQAVLPLRNLPVAPGHQMFHHPGLHMSHEPFAASGYRTRLFWKGFVFTNKTPEITCCPAAASIWKDQRSAERRGVDSPDEKKKSEQQDVSVLPGVYLGLKCTSQGVTRNVPVRGTSHSTRVRDYSESWITQSPLSNERLTREFFNL